MHVNNERRRIKGFQGHLRSVPQSKLGPFPGNQHGKHFQSRKNLRELISGVARRNFAI